MHIQTIAQAAQRSLDLQAADFEVFYEGSISIVAPLTPGCEEWLLDNLPHDVAMWGGCGRVIEHRFVRDIVDGMLEAGLRSTCSPR